MTFEEWTQEQIELGFLKVSTINTRYGRKGNLVGKWKDKYNWKKNNSIACNREFTLSFEEYLYKAYQANLNNPNQIGPKSNSYHLGRCKDLGGYTKHNCRFITHKENTKERDKYKINNLYNLNKEVNPWHNNMANEESKKVWAKADEYYTWWLETKGGYISLQKKLNTKTRACRTLIEKFKKGWIPIKDSNWLEWRVK